MIEFDELILQTSTTLVVDGFPPIHLESESAPRGRCAELSLRIADELKQVPNFAEVAAKKSTESKFPTRIYSISGVDEEPFLYLVGLLLVLYINPHSLRIQEVVRLRRDLGEDPGYYIIQVHEYPESILLRYESGLCRVDHAGKLIWHTPLCWDDVYLRHGNDGLYFSNEFVRGGEEWLIRLDNGEVSPRTY